MTLAERLARARTSLMGAGIAEAEATVDVDLYAREILGWDRARLLTHLRDQAPEALEPRLAQWVTRRSEQREPTAYIVGWKEFWGLPFRVTPEVLIPRPESEFIVEEALPLLHGLNAPRIADIGTGSGCLAVSLAHEVATASFVATDVSDTALTVARTNAEANGVGSRIQFIRTSYLDGVPGPFDLIVSNPPYVREGDKPGLAKAVRHEPEVALFGGSDGLRDIAGVLDTVARALRPGGWFVMEFGYNQDDDVRRLVDERHDLRLDHIRDDLQGIPRTAIIQHT